MITQDTHTTPQIPEVLSDEEKETENAMKGLAKIGEPWLVRDLQEIMKALDQLQKAAPSNAHFDIGEEFANLVLGKTQL